jgi:hypothetical protein
MGEGGRAREREGERERGRKREERERARARETFVNTSTCFIRAQRQAWNHYLKQVER